MRSHRCQILDNGKLEFIVMKQATYIGLDLGSFQTTAIASDGQRYSIPSAVAWPSDVFWDDVADGICQFGEHLRDSNAELDIVYPMHKSAFRFLDSSDTGLNQDEAAQARHSLRVLARHAVSEVSPMSSLPVYGVIGCPVRASDTNRQMLLDCVKDMFTGLMIVPDPLLVAFAANLTKDALVIDIGAGTTDISPIVDGELKKQDCITLPMGGDWIEDALAQEIAAKHNSLPVPQNTLREIKEVFGSLYDDGSPATVTVLDDFSDSTHDDSTDADNTTHTDVNVREALSNACRILGPSISNALHEVLSAFDAKTVERLIANTILTGGTTKLEGVSELVHQTLCDFGTPHFAKFNDAQIFANGACQIAEATSLKNWVQLSELNAPKELLRAA
jgi:actin-like ATPase involved in cell morphogenesis